MMRAWHFVGDRLRNGDPVPPDGKRLVWHGPLVMCEAGLHASVQPFDALKYAPGPVLCMVECNGGIIHDMDKLVCSQRTIIARMDATDLMRYFARMQAVSVVHLWDVPDVVLDYLMTGDESLHTAAAGAARAAALSVARATEAAAGAAKAAAWAVAGAADPAARAAWAVAGAADPAARAAWAAAWAAEAAAGAARAAALSVAGATEAEFKALVYECFGVNQ